MDNQQVSSKEIDLSWLAAAIEGEGSISFHIGSHIKRGGSPTEIVPMVCVYNTDWQFIDACYRAGCYVTGGYITHRRRNPRHKPSWTLTWQGVKRCSKLLEAVLPYMKSDKKRRAELLLNYLKSRLTKGSGKGYNRISSEELVMLIEIRRLNNKNDASFEKLQRLYTEQFDREKLMI